MSKKKPGISNPFPSQHLLILYHQNMIRSKIKYNFNLSTLIYFLCVPFYFPQNRMSEFAQTEFVSIGLKGNKQGKA